MLRLVRRRLLVSIPVLLGALTLAFVVLTLLPGDSVNSYAGNRMLTAAQRAALRERYGLDDPPLRQYLDFVGGALRGDFGISAMTNTPVSQRLGQQLGPSLVLGGTALAAALVVGVGGGVLTSLIRRRWLVRLVTTGWLTVLSIPGFWLGMALITVVAFELGWLPATGTDGWRSLVLPVITLALAPAAVIAQLVRDSLVRLDNEQFVVAARAKGLSRAQVLVRHSLRNVMLPVVTLAGVLLGGLLANAVIVETVFARRGIGRLLVTSILDQDMAVVRAIVLLIAVSYVVVNIVVDVLYALIDPRIRDSQGIR